MINITEDTLYASYMIIFIVDGYGIGFEIFGLSIFGADEWMEIFNMSACLELVHKCLAIFWVNVNVFEV